MMLSEDSENEADRAANRGASHLSLTEKAIIVEKCKEGMILLRHHSCITRFNAKGKRVESLESPFGRDRRRKTDERAESHIFNCVLDNRFITSKQIADIAAVRGLS
eukprot:scaffold954_cov173-Ochromonas_danica.AAC.26